MKRMVVGVYRMVEDMMERLREEEEEGVVLKGIGRELRTEGGCSEEDRVWQ